MSMYPSTRIREIREADYLDYKELIGSNISNAFFLSFVRDVLNDSHVIVIVENDDSSALIGTGTLLIEEKMTHGGCKMGHIENVLVERTFRGCGQGEKLVEHLLNLAKSKGCYRVDLNCSSELESFYRKNGFSPKHMCMNKYFPENFAS